MTKKQQNRSRGFGSRTLSVLLALLMILSTFAVMITALPLTAHAADEISYWFVSGTLNGWTQTATSVNKINGSSGSVTIPVSGLNKIEFKMVAYQNGNHWNGNSSGSITDNTASALKWDDGSNITFSFNSSATSLTFEVYAQGMTNYVKVKANYDSTPDDPTPVDGENSYTAKVKTDNADNSAVTWVDATYYDYLSDAEISNGWLRPSHVGTGYNGALDEWYPFYLFNRDVVKRVADANSGWSTPLYFGNFCNTYGAYDGVSKPHHVGTPAGKTGYEDATGSGNVTQFNYRANNSNGVYDMYTSYLELMGSELNNGSLQTYDGTTPPYFDEALLGDKAKIVKSAFPFRKTELVSSSGTPYTRYEFDSTNATDNVYFTWKTEGGKTYPEYVNYGAGTTYGVKDGIKDFMNTESGYGIFPFNNASSNNKGSRTYANDNLDYGFGIRMDMKFRVPDNTEVKFDFSGDDDLWVYITDESDGSSQLILDMGGSHKMSEGVVDFNAATSTVYKADDANASNKDIWVQEESMWGSVVMRAWDDSGNAYWYYPVSSGNLYRFHDNSHGYDDSGNYIENSKTLGEMKYFLLAKDTNYTNQTSDLNIADYQGKNTYTDNVGYKDNNHVEKGHCYEATTGFDFNPDHTYTMTIFYMERGLIESNCKMGFTITPLGNNFIVTQAINTENVNEGLKSKVRDISQFGFRVRDDQTLVGQNYGSFTLGNGGVWAIPDKVSVNGSEVTVLGINSNPWVEQYALTDSYLEYTADWTYVDNVNNASELDHGSGVTKIGTETSTSQKTLIDTVTQNIYDYAELEVDYVNTPSVTNVYITKEVDDPGVDHSDEPFPATVMMQLRDGEEFAAYDLETSAGTANGGRVTLKDGETITIPRVPVGTRVIVVEDADPNYTAESNTAIAGTGDSTVTVVNTPVAAPKITGKVEGTKTLDNSNYTGTLFRFRLEGIAKFADDGDDVIDTSSVRSDVTTGKFMTDNVTNGKFTIDGIEFGQPGIYRYHVYEDLSKLSVIDGQGDTTYANDIYSFGTSYLVKFTVEKQIVSGKPTLVASAPVYIPYSEWEDTVSMGDGSGEPIPHTMVKADFDKTAADVMAFDNYVEKGSVRIEKQDQSSNPVEGVTFAVYALDDSLYSTLEAIENEEEKYDLIKMLSPVKTGVTAEETAYDDNDQPYQTGVAEITDLDIYQSGYTTSSAPKYQQYVMIELSGPADYNINKTVHSFKFPLEGQYHCTYKYINGYLRSPTTAGVGMMLFKIIGWSFAGVSVLALAAYLIYTKKYAKRKTAKHLAK